MHLVNEKVDCTSFLSDQIRLVVSTCDCIATDIGRLKVLIQVSDQIRLVVSTCHCIATDIGRLKVLIQVSDQIRLVVSTCDYCN